MSMFQSIIDTLKNNTPLTITSLANVRNESLRKSILTELSSNGSFLGNSMFAEPFFESMFPWEQNSMSVDAQIAAQQIHPVIQKLHVNGQGEPYSHLYKHQASSIAQIRKGAGKSIVVTTGTSSGKTECFLYSIFDALARRYAPNANETHPDSIKGVCALFLYPLNALIQSQGERLEKFCTIFNQYFDSPNLVRFANYTGKMPDDVSLERDTGVEIKGRKMLRKSPPQLLVTNSTMLEYALIRKKDANIFGADGFKNLQFVVLDEAHNYTGSNAAELAMRLRRTLLAFGKKPSEVQFIATSATVGGAAQMKEFLAKISGKPVRDIEVIDGRRLATDIKNSESKFSIEEVLQQVKDGADAFAALEKCKIAKKLRAKMNEPSNQKMSLSSIKNVLQVTDDTTALRFLDVVSTAQKDGEYFLPLKMHLFQKEFPGVWACSNPNCSHRQATLGKDWKFGKLFFDIPLEDIDSKNGYFCECGHPVFQVVACRNCGEPYLAAQTENNEDFVLRLPKLNEEVDDFDDSFVDGNTSAQKDSDNSTSNAEGKPVLIHECPEDVCGNKWGWQSNTKSCPSEIINNDVDNQMCFEKNNNYRCTCCNSILHLNSKMNENGSFPVGVRKNIMNFMVPAKILYNSLAKEILLKDPIKADDNKNLGGRKLLSFTDSRQGSAYYAGQQGLLAELRATRIWLLNKLRENPNASLDIQGAIKTIEDEINSLPNGAENIHMPESMQGLSARELAEFFLWRELVFRSRRKQSLETLGCLKVDYVRRIDAHTVVNIIDELGGRNSVLPQELNGIVSKSQYASFLKILLDFGFRHRGALNCSFKEDELKKAFGQGIAIKPFDLESFGTLSKVNDQITFEASRTVPDVLNEIAKLTLPYVTTDTSVTISTGIWHNICVLIWTAVKQLSNLSHLQKASTGSKLSESTFLICEENKKKIKDAKTGKEKTVNVIGFKINLDCIQLSIPHEVWLCPATNTFVDCLIKGKMQAEGTIKCYSPYIISVSEATHPEITSSPIPFDSIVAELKKALPETSTWWIDLHSNALNTESDEAYVIAQEDTAQIDADQRETDQKDFKDGYINILNCSTTMEMGVDIGDVSLVAHTNLPPHEYNYIQRAGRAGRKGQGQSFVWTLIGFGAHEHRAAQDPLKWVTTSTLRQGLESISKVVRQRHINAYLLNQWLKSHDRDINFEQRSMYFFLHEDTGTECEEECNKNWEKNVIQLMVNNTKEIAKEDWDIYTQTEFSQMLEQHVANSPIIEFCNNIEPAEFDNSLLEGFSKEEAIQTAKESYLAALTKWKNRVLVLYNLFNQDENKTVHIVKEKDMDGNLIKDNGTHFSKYQKSIRHQLKKMFTLYGLSYLIEQGVLPANGMPTDVVELLIKDKKENPSRERKIAIREFAPGSTLIRNGLRYTSHGIILNWKPYCSQGQKDYSHTLTKYMTCKNCGSPWWSDQDQDQSSSTTCSYCSSPILGTPRTIIEPIGFKTSTEEDRSIGEIVKSTYEPPHVKILKSGKDTVIPLNSYNPEVLYGEMGRAEIFYLNGNSYARNLNESDPEDNRYSKDDLYHLCLNCGFIGRSADEFNGPLHENFSRKNGDGRCSIKTKDESAYQRVSLAAVIRSNAVIIKIPALAITGDGKKAFIAANTWGLAIRNALADILFVDQAELGWSVQTIKENAKQFCAICLYDNAVGGAELCYQLNDHLIEVLESARQTLQQCSCDSVCLNCLLSRETQVMANKLHRKIALEFLGNDFFNSFNLPKELKYWGESTKYSHNLLTFIRENLDSPEVKRVRLFLDDSLTDQMVCDWCIRDDINHHREKIQFVVSENRWDNRLSNDGEGLDCLEELMSMTQSVSLIKSLPKISGQAIVAEIISDEKTVQVTLLPSNSVEEAQEQQSSIYEKPFELSFLSGKASTPTVIDKECVLRDLYPVKAGDTQNYDFPAGKQISIGNFGLEILEQLKVSRNNVKKISYSDVYLRTPLTIRLLLEIIEKFHAPEIAISSTYERIKEKNIPLWSKEIQTVEMQKNVTQLCLNKICANSNVNIIDSTISRQKLPHDRKMIIEYNDHSKWRIKCSSSFGTFKLLNAYREEDLLRYAQGAEDMASAIVTDLMNDRKVYLEDYQDEISFTLVKLS